MNSNGQADIGYWKMIEMQKDPVAWMLADKEAEHIRSIMAVQHDFVPEGCVEIPLYTHPVKEQDCYGDGNVYRGVRSKDSEVQTIYFNPVKEQDCYGDGNVYRGVRSKDSEVQTIYFNPVKELTAEDRSMLIRTLKWAEDLLREAGHDEAVNDVQDCLMILRKAQE